MTLHFSDFPPVRYETLVCSLHVTSQAQRPEAGRYS